jgi:hypothetical protein
MPIETVKCPSCGSPETIELKPDSYICKYCETKFKWIDPSVQHVKIEKPICSCGHEAAGFCIKCATPVCANHRRELSHAIDAQARSYFLGKVFPLLNWDVKTDQLLCETCFAAEAKELLSRVEALKGRGNFCIQPGCFSMELVACDGCKQARYCTQHTPTRKKFARGLFAKSSALTYERVCPSCYEAARADTSKKVYWE